MFRTQMSWKNWVYRHRNNDKLHYTHTNQCWCNLKRNCQLISIFWSLFGSMFISSVQYFWWFRVSTERNRKTNDKKIWLVFSLPSAQPNSKYEIKKQYKLNESSKLKHMRTPKLVFTVILSLHTFTLSRVSRAHTTNRTMKNHRFVSNETYDERNTILNAT